MRSGFGAALEQVLLPLRLTTYMGRVQAVCLVVRDQHVDIREWLHHHAALGVSKFYVFDNNSSSPMLSQLEDLARRGIVEYHFLTSFRHHSNRCEKPQPVPKPASLAVAKQLCRSIEL